MSLGNTVRPTPRRLRWYDPEWRYRRQEHRPWIVAVLRSDAAAGGHQTDRESGLDGERRIDWLTASPSGGWCTPRSDRLVSKPRCQRTPSHQRRVIVRPVRHTIFRRGEFVATRLVELVGHGFLHRGIGRPATLPSAHPDRQSGLCSLDVPPVSRNDAQSPGVHAPTRSRVTTSPMQTCLQSRRWSRLWPRLACGLPAASPSK